MKPTKENIATLKKMGFKNRGDGEFELGNGWSFNIASIASISELVKRLYVGMAEAIIDVGHDFEYGGWVLIPFEKEEYARFEKIIKLHESQKRLEKAQKEKIALEKAFKKAKNALR